MAIIIAPAVVICLNLLLSLTIHTDNFRNIFNGVTFSHVFSHVFSYHNTWNYFLTMPVGFNFNITYELKFEFSRIKLATVYRQSIFQVEWLIATLILQTSSQCQCKFVNKIYSRQRYFEIRWHWEPDIRDLRATEVFSGVQGKSPL